MMAFGWGSFLGGLGGLASGLGSIFGNSSADEIAQQNMVLQQQQQKVANQQWDKMYKLSDQAYRASRDDVAWQRQYLGNRVSQTVADAKRAGIHPLAALGAGGTGQLVSGGVSLPGPSGATAPYMDPSFAQGDAIGSALAEVGRGISAAYESDLEQEERERDRDLQRQIENRRQMEIDIEREAQFWREQQAQRAQQLNESLIAAQIGEITSRTALMRARAAAIGGPTSGHVSQGTVEPPFGESWNTAPTTDAQRFADRYGDLLGEGYGILNFLRDSADHFEW